MLTNEKASSEAMESKPIFDLADTLRRLGGNSHLLAELIQLYDEDSPELLRRLEAGTHAHRAEEVRHAAHSLRGLAVNFGAGVLTDSLCRLEKAAIDGQLDEAPFLLDQIRSQSAQLQNALAAYHQ